MKRFSVLLLGLLGLGCMVRADGLLVLHVDFNTLQHDRRALSSLLKRAAADGYNAVLWEIENKIRFDCCPEAAAPDAFTKEEFREILAEARGLGLEPIPLVQSFGHLEWLLKRSRWRHLREVPDMTRCCCPSKPETRQFLRRLLRECLDLFGPDVKRFHLGGDEVWELGKCPVCAKRDPMELYAEHMEALAAELRSRGVRPGCWHDMVFKHAKGDGKYSGLASDYTIWFWDYAYPDRWHAWTVAEDQIRELVRSGREMVFCASSQSWWDDPFLVRYGMHRRNIAGGADLARREKMTGLCVTSWTIHQGLKELQYPLFDFAAKRYRNPGADAEADWRAIAEKNFGRVPVEAIDAVSDWNLELGDADGRGWYRNKDGEVPPSAGLSDRFREKGEAAKKLAGISSEIASRTREALKVWKEGELTDLGRLAVEAAELKAAFQEITARSLRGEDPGELPRERTKAFYARGYAPWSAQRAADIIFALHERDPHDWGEPRLRFGALSDIHIATPANQDIFEKALRKFDEWKADGVLASGDLADHGLVQQLQLVADSWFKVFPDGKGSDGRTVVNLMHFGDHDTSQKLWMQKTPASVWSEDERRAGVIIKGDRAAIWKKCFREDWAPIQLKTVKGYDFILCHFTFGEADNLHGNNTPGLAEFFAGHDFSRTRPMFLSQHRPPRGTILGPFEIPSDNQDDGRSGRIFSDYPNLTVFFGHLHDSAANEKNVWQGRYNVIHSPSLSYAVTRGGRENGYNAGDRVTYSPKNPPKLMHQHPAGRTHQGLFCTVYDQAIVVRRYDFEYDLDMGPEWVIPISSFAREPSEKPYSPVRRVRELAVPEFSAGARVAVAEIRAKDRAGTMREMLDVTFPPALVAARANDYEVTAEVGQDDVWRVLAQKRVYSPRYQYSPEMETEPVHCWFSRDEIPKGWPIRYSVRPCNAFGVRGRPIFGGWDGKGNSLTACGAAEIPRNMHLFLLGGQSNMSGRGSLSATNRIDHERIFVLTPSGDWRPAVEPFHWEKPKANGAGLAASFARAYADAHPGVSVGLVPVAYGGSSIRNWQPGRVHYTNAVAYARLALRQGEFKGFLWHQGESDAFTQERVAGYVPLFTNAIVRLRRELGIEGVPFVAGELGPYLKDWRDQKRPNIHWQEMNAEIARGVELLPHAALVSSAGLFDVRADRIHFETPSLRQFGLRYYSVYAGVQAHGGAFIQNGK